MKLYMFIDLLTRKYTKVGIADFDEIWLEYSFQRNS